MHVCQRDAKAFKVAAIKYSKQHSVSYSIGYEQNTSDTDKLMYGLSPFTNCLKYFNDTLYLRTLPQDASNSLENETCHENYCGILCSKCREGMTTTTAADPETAVNGAGCSI